MLRKGLGFILTVSLITACICLLPLTCYAEFGAGEKPQSLQLSDYTTYSSSEDLSWESLPGASGYAVYVNGAEKARVTDPSYHFTDLAPYTSYNIYVKAFDEAGNLSEASDSLSITTEYENLFTVGSGEVYATIQDAVNNVNPGDVVLVKDGTYDGDVAISLSGTAEKWITIMAESTDALIRGGITIDADYIRVAGFKMDALVDDTYLYKMAFYITGDYSQIQENNITNYSWGVAVDGGSHAYVANNYLYKCAQNMMTGDDSIFEYNDISYLDKTGRTIGDADYFRVFGVNVIIRNNYCHGTVNGPHLGAAHVDFLQSYDTNEQYAQNVLIENNIFTDYAAQGIMMGNQQLDPDENFYLSDWTIRNNVFCGFIQWGVDTGKGLGVPNMTVENNIFIGDPAANDGVGPLYGVISRGPATNSVIRNNIIMNISNMSYGTMDGGVIDTAENNLIYNAPNPPVSVPTDIIGMDPLFVDAANGDFHLQSASPAIDTGAQAATPYDLEGKVRPFGSGYDIGPYEFYGTKANTPPVITITAPTPGQSYTVGTNALITANVTDDKKPVKVEYFIDDAKAGESTQTPFDFTIPDIQEGIYKLYAIAYDEEGASTQTENVYFFSTDTPPVVIGGTWTNISFDREQQGIITASFDVTPLNEVGSAGYILGLTLGEASDFKDVAIPIRFNTLGMLDALNDKKYFADNEISYTPGKNYHITAIVNIPEHTYSVFVKENEGDTQILCTDYLFRSTMQSVTALDNVACFGEIGSFALSGYSIQDDLQETGMIVTAPERVSQKQDFNVQIGYDLPDEVLDADISFSYNADLFEYKGYTLTEGGLLVAGHVEDPGTVRLLLAGTGAEGAISRGIPLIELQFESKETEGTGEINVTGATLVSVDGNPLLPELSGETILVNNIIPGDLNDDELVNVLDLYLVSINYWKNDESPDWDTAKIADCNSDGKVDIEDLVFVAGKILGK